MGISDIGSLGSSPIPQNGFTVNPTDPTDIFKFHINDTSNINLSLTNISAGDDLDLALFRDVNGNGVLDQTDRNTGVIGNSATFTDEAINVRADAGTYFAEVRRFDVPNSGDATYNLALSATLPNSIGGYNNLLPKESELGNLSGDVTRHGFLSNDNTSEVYHFSLGYFEGVNISLDGLSSDADIRLIHDSNNNRIVDAGEQIKLSKNGGTRSELISNITDAGDYFLQVNQYTGNTGFDLTFDHFATPDL